MKLLLRYSLVLVLLAVTGCITGRNDSGRALMAVSTTVDSAMKAWMIHVVDGKATAEQEKLVEDIHAKYLKAQKAAKLAYAAVANNQDKSALTQTFSALYASRDELVGLVKLFTQKKVTN